MREKHTMDRSEVANGKGRSVGARTGTSRPTTMRVGRVLVVRGVSNALNLKRATSACVDVRRVRRVAMTTSDDDASDDDDDSGDDADDSSIDDTPDDGESDDDDDSTIVR